LRLPLALDLRVEPLDSRREPLVALAVGAVEALDGSEGPLEELLHGAGGLLSLAGQSLDLLSGDALDDVVVVAAFVAGFGCRSGSSRGGGGGLLLDRADAVALGDLGL
jgi:hypothetical protein